MKRFLILLLVLLLPLKAAAAHVVAIAGAPGHAHATQHAGHDAAGAGHSPHSPYCAAMADVDEPDTPAGALHDHGCPHLGMASMATAIVVFDGSQAPLVAPARAAVRFSSITLDVPRPPPTRAR